MNKKFILLCIYFLTFSYIPECIKTVGSFNAEYYNNFELFKYMFFGVNNCELFSKHCISIKVYSSIRDAPPSCNKGLPVE